MWLWLRHPMRRFHLFMGYCPVCNSSPPDEDCSVCLGSYSYGPFLNPEERKRWLARFRIWTRL